MRPGERQAARHGAPAVAPVGTGPAVAPFADADTDAEADTSGIPEAVRAAARRAPGHWIGVVDPGWTEERTPPEWAVLGEWQSDETGGVGEYRPNPAYRPSARVLGWPEPTDPVDAASQRAATGYGSTDEAIAALAEADVTVMRGPDGGPLTATGRDGAPMILVFTSSAHEFMSAELHHDIVPARDLARSPHGPGTLLLVNAGAAAPLLVPADSLLAPVRGTVPAVDQASALSSGAAGDAGTPAWTLATDRTDHSAAPWPHTTGRTP